MADLFNLDAELLADQDLHLDDGNDEQEDEEQEQGQEPGEEWDHDDAQGGAEQVHVLITTAAATTTSTDDHASASTSTQPQPHQPPQDRFDLEDLVASATTQDLDYNKLYSLWIQETQSPELLPFPTALFDRIQAGIARANTTTTTTAAVATNKNVGTMTTTTNDGLNALLTSLRTIDADRVTFLLADLLQRRLRKIEAHPLYYMSTQQDCMSPHEQAFWRDYRELVQQHLYQTVTQHFPDRENWREVVPGEPNLHHFYCFAQCVDDDVSIERSPGDMQRYAAGDRIVVRYDKIQHHLQRGSMVLMSGQK